MTRRNSRLKNNPPCREEAAALGTLASGRQAFQRCGLLSSTTSAPLEGLPAGGQRTRRAAASLGHGGFCLSTRSRLSSTRL